MSFLFKPVIVVLLSLALIGCKSDAERADEFFLSAKELLDEGDIDRAMVQFRNVFEFAPTHRESRMSLGDYYKEQHRPAAAYRQYVQVAEQFPDDFEARSIVAELAFSLTNWEEFTRHGEAAVQLSPEDERAQAISLGLNYREAVLSEDNPAQEALTQQAAVLLESLPQNAIVNGVLLDSYARNSQPNKMLERIDALLVSNPNSLQLHTQRLAVFGQLQDLEALEAQLQDMVQRFPENEETQAMLLRFYVAQRRLDDAEAFLRELSDPADEDPTMFLSLVNFITQTRGQEAARVELERAVAVNPRPALFRGMIATMDFEAGKQEEAIAEMESILEGADLAQDDIQAIKTFLARMLVNTGNQVGARRHVEEVLSQNPSNVDALKMQASWQLQADEVDQALANLRIALDTAPQDIQVMNLLYEAYVRLGDDDVAREYLVLAVEASGNAPEPSMTYARVLMQEERYLPAEDVLLPALRQAPQNVELLGMLGELYLRQEDMPRARQVINTLRRIDTDGSRSVANALQTQSLAINRGPEEALSFLEELAGAEDAGLNAQLNLMRARLQVGETDQALEIARKLSEDNPDDLRLKQALAVTLDATGNTAEAQGVLREIVVAEPRAANAWVRLATITRRLSDADTAQAVIDEGLAATNNNVRLLWAKASLLEQTGDVDGAIGIYEDLYETNSSSLVFANNLASLLSTYREDEESLERAWVVGRRLRNADNPIMQDTYGWLLYRRGQVEEALPYLESAAAALNDPMVQAHLGFAYLSLSRNDEALKQLQRAVDIAGPADTRKRIEVARAEIARLQSQPEN